VANESPLEETNIVRIAKSGKAGPDWGHTGRTSSQMYGTPLRILSPSADGSAEEVMRALRILAVLAIAAGLVVGSSVQTADGTLGNGTLANGTLWRYVHPEAKFLLGVDWQKAKVSSVGKMLSRKLAEQKGLKVSRTTQGLEMLDKVNLILVSSPTIEGMSEESPGRVLVALEGKFDKAAFRRLMPDGTAVERFKGVDLFVPLKAKKDELLAAYVSEQFALLGDRASLAEVLDGAGAGMKDQTLMERATSLASRCEMWLVANAPPTASGAPPSAGPMQQLQDLDSLDLGVGLSKGLGLEMNMNMKTVESAQGISMMAQMFLGMAANQTRESDELSRALRSMKVSQNGRQVHMALNISTATLERGMVAMKSSIETKGRQAMEAMLAGGFAGTKAAPARPAARANAETAAVAPLPPPRPVEPVKRTIRIVGLESGDREVSYNSRQR
jgi:hypothetical protein